jgi:rubrerythrin
MIIHTASEGISLAKKLENDSAKYYEDIAKKITGYKDTFLSYSKENRKNITQIERAYYGVITDAIEGCFAFNIETDNYAINISVEENAGNEGLLKQAVENEERIIDFYKTAAEQSKSFMADVPSNFLLIARKREKRLTNLKSLTD